MRMRFLDPQEMAALKFAIGQSEGLSIEECCDWDKVKRYFLTPETNFMLYHTGEQAICLAWILGDDKSFIEFFVHEELHRVLHERIDLSACCSYDNVARYVETSIIEVLVRAK